MRIRIGKIILASLLVTTVGCGIFSQPAGNPPPIADKSDLKNIGVTRVADVDGMVLIYVPAGEFIMGSDVGLTDEQPAHEVFLDAYWFDQTEITNELYAKCVAAGKCDQPSVPTYYNDPDFARHPVEFVSWNDAEDYCSWAGRRMPTEAEWEKVASWDPYHKAQHVYPWGNEYDCSAGNFDDEIELDASLMQIGVVGCDGFVRSAPVGSFPGGASIYGALDLGGNVWEWAHDAFLEVDPLNSTIENYYSIAPYENPQGVDPSMTDYRVVRGGSYNLTFGFGRAAYRLWYGLNEAYEGVGFRCAVSD
jgi:formylglycine-generating enzyme required for sulfatase activity